MLDLSFHLAPEAEPKGQHEVALRDRARTLEVGHRPGDPFETACGPGREPMGRHQPDEQGTRRAVVAIGAAHRDIGDPTVG
jgi:hypothetical protein